MSIYRQITGSEVWVTFTIGTAGNSHLNLSTLADRIESGASSPTNKKIAATRAFIIEITSPEPFYGIIDQAADTTPTTSLFQHYDSEWRFIRAGHGESNGRDLYLHALAGSATTLGVSAYPLDSALRL